jgi:hypothetical protein
MAAGLVKLRVLRKSLTKVRPYHPRYEGLKKAVERLGIAVVDDDGDVCVTAPHAERLQQNYSRSGIYGRADSFEGLLQN